MILGPQLFVHELSRSSKNAHTLQRYRFFFAAIAVKRSPGPRVWRSELCWICSCGTLSSLRIRHRQSATPPLAHQGCFFGLSIFLEAGGCAASSTLPSFPFNAAHRLGRIQFLSLAVFRSTSYSGRPQPSDQHVSCVMNVVYVSL